MDDMDSKAPEESAADANDIEDVLPKPSAGVKGADADVSQSVSTKASEGVPDLDTEEDSVPEEAVSVASKLSGEEPDLQQARR